MRTPLSVTIAVTLSLFITVAPTQAQDSSIQAVALVNYYDRGMKAYNEKDFLTALKYLFAYRSANEKVLKDNQDFLITLDKAIAYCEMKLSNSVPQNIHIIGQLEELNREQVKVVHQLQVRIVELQKLEAEMIHLKSSMESEVMLLKDDVIVE